MDFKDYYKVMGQPRDATDAQIKQAYRKLARKYHPDVSKEKDAEARFKELGEAYEVLKNPEKRAAYDQLGLNHRAGEEFRPPPDWGAGFEFSGAGPSDSVHSDFFEALFGAASQGRSRDSRGAFGQDKGEDHHAKVLLDLESTLLGGTRTFTLQVPHIDPQGHLVSTKRVLNVQVPKGILPGQHIRLKLQGAPALAPAPGTKGTPGDLFIEVEFQSHSLYRIDGRDLYLDLPVSPWEAALGASVQAPTPQGNVELKIPAGSHTGSKLRLKSRGIPAAPPGDLYAVLQVTLPPVKDDKAREAYQAMAAALPFNPRIALGV